MHHCVEGKADVRSVSNYLFAHTGAGILEAAWKAMKDVKEALDAQERIRRTPNTANREHLGRLHVQHASNPNILLFDDLLSPLDTVILEQLVEKAQGPWDNLQSALQEAKAQKKQLPEQQTHRFYEFLLNTVAELHPHDNLAVHDPSGTGLGGSGNRRNWVILDGSCSTPAYVVWRLEEKSSIEPSWEYHESICQLEERTATAAAQQPQRQAVPGAVAGHDSLELWWRRAAGNSERSGILPVTCDTQSLGLQYLVRLWGTKPSVLGYQQPHLPTDLQHPDGRPLTDLRRLYIRGGDSESMPNEIVAEVVAATAGSEHFVAKTSEEVDYEVRSGLCLLTEDKQALQLHVMLIDGFATSCVRKFQCHCSSARKLSCLGQTQHFLEHS